MSAALGKIEDEPGGDARLESLRRELGRAQESYWTDAGESGELLVAQIRLIVVGLLLLIQLTPQEPQERVVGLGISLAALAAASLMFLAVRYRYRPWMAFASCALDATLVSAGLATFLVLGRPHTAVNSKVVFEVYFLAVAGAGLRYNWRLCALTSLVAVSEYAGIVAYATTHWSLNDPRYAPFEYGMFSWSAQAARFVILGAAGVLSTTIVLRAQRLRRLSAVDRLTGLLNRRSLEERLAQEVSRAERYARPLAVAFLDIDLFKRLNDTYGHPGGDTALETVARALKRSVRRSDVAARYGGEEFVLLLPETAAEEATVKLEAIRRSIGAEPVAIGGARVRLTVSAGVAAWPADGGEIEEVVARADERLYEAKRLGRNRVVGPAPAAA